MEHEPVLLDETLAALAVRPAALYVDATYGAGGHTRALVERGARVLAFDRDPNAAVASDLCASVELVHRNFDELARTLDERGIERVDGVLFDLGVSSMQLDRPE
ncbi:MAG TPA: 16S rRNA (cytosine(1402)-N(4))-methyltransferase, partial [Candidatus Baltobacteraceae bacterium]|nr:16S rRNA (cytosine(1402)-N(4))-methyltransferase [Candidatus Baltobacteraceae bacterium]